MKRYFLILIICGVLFSFCENNKRNQSIENENSIEADSLYQEAVKLLNSDKDPYALQLLSKALNLVPDNVLYNLDRGVAHMNVMEYEKAKQDFLVVLSLDSLNVKAMFNLAVVLNNLEQFDDSIIYTNKAIQLNPQFCDLFLIRGESYLFKADTLQMCKDYTTALQKGCSNAKDRLMSHCIKTKEINVENLPSFLKFKPLGK